MSEQTTTSDAVTLHTAGGSPAEALVGGLLVEGHGVHELQAGALVRPPQQCPAVAVDHAHPLQRLEEALPYRLLLPGRAWLGLQRAVYLPMIAALL